MKYAWKLSLVLLLWWSYATKDIDSSVNRYPILIMVHAFVIYNGTTRRKHQNCAKNFLRSDNTSLNISIVHGHHTLKYFPQNNCIITIGPRQISLSMRLFTRIVLIYANYTVAPSLSTFSFAHRPTSSLIAVGH